ncbi:hypothetical protein NAE47_000286 [Listeria monocytogenes]|nr:hypothetical protein [Listeria monocytogenes]EIR0059168.1 hypothetical protein [Listeria monocytogenes]EIT9492098.1 hypothetical protein [Listeria monocytogenes]EIT9495103.1 hypothetical protein [Listeria monocytogenes]EIT9498053.1 hypothetical protein [Listeria monocytogenes]
MYQSLSNIIINLQANKDLLLQQDNEVDRIKSILPLVVARNSIIETLGRNPVRGISLTDDVNNLKIDNQLVTEVIPFDWNNETLYLCYFSGLESSNSPSEMGISFQLVNIFSLS